MSTQMIPCDLIDADQSLNIGRQNFTPADCEELAASIAVHGLQTPIMVRPVDSRYEIIFGFRRYTAVAINLGLEEIECKVVNMDREQAKIANVVENLQRSDLTFWEECCAIKTGFPADASVREVAKSLGKTEYWVNPRLNLWKMPQKIIDQVESGVLTATHVYMLLNSKEEDRAMMAYKIRRGLKEGHTTEEIRRKLGGQRRVRCKRDLKMVMTRCLENEHQEVIAAFMYALGEITDAEFYRAIGVDDKDANNV